MLGRRLFRPRLAFDASRAGAARAGEGGGPLLPGAERERFQAMILPHLDSAFSLARYLSRDPSAAEDIVQNAFLRALRGFAAFRGESPKAWLLAIVRNCFRDWARERQLDSAHGASEAAEAAAADCRDFDTPDEILARRQQAELTHAAVEALPEPFREALVLREFEELSYKEIAAVSGVPIGTVMSRLARARQMLANLILPRGDAESQVLP